MYVKPLLKVNLEESDENMHVCYFWNAYEIRNTNILIGRNLHVLLNYY